MPALLEPVNDKKPPAPRPEPMTIEYQLGIDDVMALHVDNTRKSLKATLKKMGLSLLLVFAVSVPILIQTLDQQFIEVWVLFALCVPLWGFIVVRMFKKRQEALRKYIEDGRNRQLHGTRRLTISETGVREETPFTMSRSAWQVIEKVVALRDHIYICVGNLTVYTIPRSAFKSEDHRQKFLDTVKVFHSAVSRGNCRKCGYDLLGNTSGRCPECGKACPESAV